MEDTGKCGIPVFNILEKTCFVTLAHPKYTKPQKENETLYAIEPNLRIPLPAKRTVP